MSGGGAFGIYPEGTRSRDGRLYRGRTGVAWLASTCSRAPSYPSDCSAATRSCRSAVAFRGSGRVTVRFGTPLAFDDLAAGHPAAVARRMATDSVMDAIAGLTGQERAAAYNELPTAS